jgi:hypothetical protein
MARESPRLKDPVMNLDWPLAVKVAAKMGTRMARKIVGVMIEREIWREGN